MLRKIRTILAAVFFVLITLLFLDFTGTLHHRVTNTRLRTNLLLCNLSSWSIPGYSGQIAQKEEQVQLF